MTSFDIVVATDENNGIGFKGSIPWRLPGDLKYFKDLTTKTNDAEKQNCCIMGWNTYFSIPEKFRPLDKRINVVLSRKEDAKSQLPENVLTFKNLENALESVSLDKRVESVFVIGGEQIYAEALKSPHLRYVYKTLIHHKYECDVRFPMDPNLYAIEGSELKTDEKIGVDYRFFKFGVWRG